MGSGLRYTGNYGSGYQEHLRAKTEAQVAAERALLRATHDRNVKLNALNKARGQGGKFECTKACPTCYPDLPAAQGKDGLRLGVNDLRGKVTPVVLRGKRGKCKDCGAKTPTRRGWFCAPCLARRQRSR